jgi:predicted DNA-binding protein (MmcQ/YjbR family)
MPGYRPAYHMNKEHWITVLLDGSVPFEKIVEHLVMSRELAGGKK